MSEKIFTNKNASALRTAFYAMESYANVRMPYVICWLNDDECQDESIEVSGASDLDIKILVAVCEGVLCSIGASLLK